MVLRRVRNSGARCIGDLDARIRQASDLRYAHQQQDKYRKDKGELYEGLSFVSVKVASKHCNPSFP
jgi:hypothetical protein